MQRPLIHNIDHQPLRACTNSAMGKRKNKSKNQHKNQHKHQHKKRKVERYWVEDCTELRPPPTIKPSLIVTISRVELHDHHTHRPPKTVTKRDTAQVREKQDSVAKVSEADCFKGPGDTNTSEKKLGMHTDTADLNATHPAVDPSAPEKKEFAKTGDVKTAFEPEASLEEVAVPIDEAFVAIQRDPSAKGPLKQFKHQNFKNLPNGDCGDGVVNPHDKSKVPDKYWAQRKRFFSRFDDGVRLDKEGWYSVTPEKIANHLAKRLVEGRNGASHQGMVVLDAFCGCGGNAIAFALRPEVSLVLAVDADREKLELTANNAMVYGVPKEKLILIHGNACDALQSYKQGIRIAKKERLKEKDTDGDDVDGFPIGGMDLLPEQIDSVFISPPWGGMDYETSGKRNYHIVTCIEVDASPQTKWNGEEILEACAIATNGPVLYFLPRNINGISLGRSALKSKYKTLEIEMNILNNKLKTVTAYLGM